MNHRSFGNKTHETDGRLLPALPTPAGVRDGKSARIIDRIFGNITFELRGAMGFSRLYSVCRKYLRGLSNEEIASSCANIRQSVEKAAAKTADTYAANGGKYG